MISKGLFLNYIFAYFTVLVSILFITSFNPVYASPEMDRARDLGKSLGSSAVDSMGGKIKDTDMSEYKREGDREFDPNAAMDMAENRSDQIPETEADKLVNDPKVKANNYRFDENDASLLNSKHIYANPASKSGVVATSVTRSVNINKATHRCQESGEPYLISTLRTRNVSVRYTPEVRKNVKICRGHSDYKKEYWKSDAIKSVVSKREELKKNQNVRDYKVWRSNGNWGLMDDYKISWEYNHFYDYKDCRNYRNEEVLVSPEKWEELSDSFTLSNSGASSLMLGPDCHLSRADCLDRNSTKSIKDSRHNKSKNVFRNCWKENLVFVCKYPPVKGCDVLRGKGCVEISSNCIKQGEGGCALWEKSFNCSGRKHVVGGSCNVSDFYGADGKGFEMEYEENTKFPEVAAKLSVFDSMRKELRAGGAANATQVRVFKGKSSHCTKNIAENLMYDCCGSFDGIMNRIGLSYCNSEEKQLAKDKKDAKCHYIGNHGREVLSGLWVSSYQHTYCCFPSKFTRVLQEQARSQLGKSWGSSRSPDCGGLSTEEISRLDFEKMDLSEILEDFKKMGEETAAQKIREFKSNLPRGGDLKDKIQKNMDDNGSSKMLGEDGKSIRSRR